MGYNGQGGLNAVFRNVDGNQVAYMGEATYGQIGGVYGNYNSTISQTLSPAVQGLDATYYRAGLSYA